MTHFSDLCECDVCRRTSLHSLFVDRDLYTLSLSRGGRPTRVMRCCPECAQDFVVQNRANPDVAMTVDGVPARAFHPRPQTVVFAEGDTCQVGRRKFVHSGYHWVEEKKAKRRAA